MAPTVSPFLYVACRSYLIYNLENWLLPCSYYIDNVLIKSTLRVQSVWVWTLGVSHAAMANLLTHWLAWGNWSHPACRTDVMQLTMKPRHGNQNNNCSSSHISSTVSGDHTQNNRSLSCWTLCKMWPQAAVWGCPSPFGEGCLASWDVYESGTSVVFTVLPSSSCSSTRSAPSWQRGVASLRSTPRMARSSPR